MAKQPQRQIVHTGDGSVSLFLPELNEHYHSIHGAVQESMHVFIQEGFCKMAPGRDHLSVLEIGFGTGLNCLLTCLEAMKYPLAVHYTALEPYPLDDEEYAALNYPDIIAASNLAVKDIFRGMHMLTFGLEGAVAESFVLHKMRERVQDIQLAEARFDLVYYDAFGPQATPDMWEEQIFRKLFPALKPGGMLVTYCARGSVKRTLSACGFSLEHPKGPPGKREITRGRKNSAEH